jgi:hypothetical protein
MPQVSELVSQMGISPAVLLDFFVSFARFEYCLKRAGYLKSGHRAQPDWDRFSSECGTWGLTEARSKEVSAAIAYLLAEPPRRQVVVDGALGWEEQNSGSQSEGEFVIQCLRTIRNNLFHGGKFPARIVPETGRNEQLLRAALLILNHVKVRTPEIEQYWAPDLSTVS